MLYTDFVNAENINNILKINRFMKMGKVLAYFLGDSG